MNRVVLHAPTAGALHRARGNWRNLVAADSTVVVRIIANADGAVEAIRAPDAEADQLLSLCANTLRNRGIEAPGGIATVPAAIEELVRLQSQGWVYIRA